MGGDQNAADGGFDVVVASDCNPPVDSYILAKYTGIQVKKPKMTAGRIKTEMLSKGKLKAELKGLISKKGAYVIVSSKDSCSKEKALKERLKMMRNIFDAEHGGENVKIDFLDSDRVATWVNLYPGLVGWVKLKNGRVLSGWKPFENWSNGVVEEYLVSEDICLKQDFGKNQEGLGVVEAINCLRKATIPKKSVRLVGLSGVGKTRLVEALFDDEIGENPLNRDLVLYTDIADDPDPDPKHLMSNLIAQEYKGVIIVDNCSRELHDKLTKICSRKECKIALLTIEYDVRDQLPEETRVFRMEPTGDELITKMLIRQFPNLSEVNARKIAESSSGNYRVAISLAKTVNKGESLATLKDDIIFDRLFRQSNDKESGLLESAEVMSLLYSFDSSNVQDEQSELAFLGSLINKSGLDMFRDASEIEARQLIQLRGIWRAILPHAVANYLTKKFLKKFPPEYIWGKILATGSERIIKSFSRRLGFLNNSKQAVEIVELMLKPAGWLGENIGELNPLCLEVLRNVSPVSPDSVLERFEELIVNWQRNGEEIANNSVTREVGQILFHLAYEDRFFSRAVDLLFHLARGKDDENSMNSPRSIIVNLFQRALSGSHATVQTRCDFLRVYLRKNDGDESRRLVLRLLRVGLEAGSLMGMSDYNFGAHSRDYGYYPKSHDERKQWFVSFLDLSVATVCEGGDTDRGVRNTIGFAFRGLWRSGCWDELVDIADEFLKYGHWLEGWCAVRSVMAYDWDKQTDDNKLRLKNLNELLRPQDDKDKVEVYISGSDRINFYPECDDPDYENIDNSYEQLAQLALELGEKIGGDLQFLKKIAPDIVTGSNNRVSNFAKGVVTSSGDFEEIWNIMRDSYALTESNNRNISVFVGMLEGLHDSFPKLHLNKLNELETDSELVQYLPLFQSYGGYNVDKLERLHRLMDNDVISAGSISSLSSGCRHSSITDSDLVLILSKLEEKEDGQSAILDILNMRFFDIRSGDYQPSEELIEFGITVLQNFDFNKNYGYHSLIYHHLTAVVRVVFKGEKRENDALAFCESLTNIFSEYGYCSKDYRDLFFEIINVQPLAFLDGWLDKCSKKQILKAFDRFDRHSPIDFFGKIDSKLLFEWLDGDSENRSPKVASIIKLLDDKGECWSQLILSLLKRYPNVTEVLEILANRMNPSSWSGSLADILEAKLKLLKQLEEKVDKKALAIEIEKFEKVIADEREKEGKESREEYMAFE